MRFKVGGFPENLDFIPEEEGWKPIREPNVILLQLLAIPIIILTIVFFKVINQLFIHIDFGSKGIFEEPLLFLLIMIIIIPIHEFLHAVLFPKPLSSSDVILGFYTKGLAFYAFYKEEMNRNRFLMVIIFPTIVLSLFPLVIMSIFSINNQYLYLGSIINAILASGDMLNMLLIKFQIPSEAKVKNKGYKTFWKEI